MKEPILVILAAGMGSRYGGLKQVDPVGPNGETILDYSLFDAQRAGFKRVVIIIKKAIEQAVKATISQKELSGLEISYAFQEIDLLPAGCQGAIDREKPWGTAHAIWCAKDFVDAPFAVINADDFYGESAYKEIYQHLTSDKGTCAMVGYPIVKTLSKFGSVSRGICQVDENNYLKSIHEQTNLQWFNDQVGYIDDQQKQVVIPQDTLVSMNFWGFTQDFVDKIEDYLIDFFKNEVPTNPLKSECYLPTVVFGLIQANQLQVLMLHSQSQWFGVTYQQDKPNVQQQIMQLIHDQKYPEKL